MKRVLLICLALAVIGGPAMADVMGIYTDQVGDAGNCSMVPPAFSPFSIYVVHKTTGATASQFKVVNSSGYSLSASVLGGFLSIGDTFTDITVAYGACLTGPSVGVVQLSGFGFPVPGPVCGLVEVVPAPDKTFVITVDCGLIEVPMQAGTFRFNTDGTCPCVDVNATEATTWGKVKSLYR